MPSFPPSLREPFLLPEEGGEGVQQVVASAASGSPLLAPSSWRGLFLLSITIGLEVSGTLLFRAAVDDARILPLAFGLYFAGLCIFSSALSILPLSVAYSTWCALGTVGVTVGSHYLYGEEISLGRWACIVGTIPLVVGMYAFP